MSWRSLYVELPPEDPLSASGRYVGKLERAMYGTRDAPMIWQDHLRKTLLDMKFKESVTQPGVFQHETRDIRLCIHVDDLLCTGVRDDLMWLNLQLLKEYELEKKLMGDDDDMEKKAVYPARTLEWSEDGLGVRPGRRHVRSLWRELGMETCRSVSTPLSLTVEKEGDRSDRPEVSANSPRNIEQRLHGLCTWPMIDWIYEWRQLSSPKPWQFQERLTMKVSNASCDTFMVNPEYVQWHPIQEETKVVLSTDAGWATCRETRR